MEDYSQINGLCLKLMNRILRLSLPGSFRYFTPVLQKNNVEQRQRNRLPLAKKLETTNWNPAMHNSESISCWQVARADTQCILLNSLFLPLDPELLCISVQVASMGCH